MHICFLAIDYHEHQGGGGIASYVETLGEEFIKRGHRVTILAKGQNKLTEKKGIQVIQVPLGNLHWYLYKMRAPSLAVLPIREIEWSWALRKRFERLHAEDPVDIVEGCETGILFLAGCKRLPPCVIRLHGEDSIFLKHSHVRVPSGVRLNRWLELGTLRRASALNAPSRFQAAEVADELGWPHERIHAIANPIHPWILEKALEKRKEPPVHRHQVLYTGRIEYCKGTIPLLNAAPYVTEKFPDAEFIIAGGRHTSISDQILNQILSKDSIRKRVRMLGHVPWQDLISWYREASLFVMPSYYETFGISVIEAMSFGLPVVATTAGALPEVVEDGVTGILVPPGDPKALGEAIVRLLKDPDLRERMGRAGRQRVLENFTVEKVAGQTLRFYQSVIENYPKGSRFERSEKSRF